MPLKNLETPGEQEARRLVTRAQEQELYHHLSKLEPDFAAWRAGTLTAVALADKLRAFNEGPARAIAKRYNVADLQNALANAVAAGLVKDGEVPAELRDELNIVVSILKSKR